jgi:hypothetical protein
MPWIIGIDEAGYGPNLGPFVMTAVAGRVPPELRESDLWQVLSPAVRRSEDADDGRIVVADSKLIYSPAGGLVHLEQSVTATFSPCRTGAPLSLAEYVDWACPACHEDLRAEPWYTGSPRLPLVAEHAGLRDAVERFDRACREQGIAWEPVQSVVVCPARFNHILEEWGSKGAVLGHALAELLKCLCRLSPEEPVSFFIDKHGGRNTYAAMLQDAIPEGFIVAAEEGRDRSVYRVLGLDREVRLTFQPRADVEHFCVALASMFSKYLREVLMVEFNRFWQERVPGLKATAGYPGDAARFMEQIRATAVRLGIAENALWRRK